MLGGLLDLNGGCCGGGGEGFGNILGGDYRALNFLLGHNGNVGSLGVGALDIDAEILHRVRGKRLGQDGVDFLATLPDLGFHRQGETTKVCGIGDRVNPRQAVVHVNRALQERFHSVNNDQRGLLKGHLHQFPTDLQRCYRVTEIASPLGHGRKHGGGYLAHAARLFGNAEKLVGDNLEQRGELDSQLLAQALHSGTDSAHSIVGGLNLRCIDAGQGNAQHLGLLGHGGKSIGTQRKGIDQVNARAPKNIVGDLRLLAGVFDIVDLVGNHPHLLIEG